MKEGIYLTDFQLQTEGKIIENYSGLISENNLATLMEHLTDENINRNVRLFTEIDGMLYYSNRLEGGLVPAQFHHLLL